MTSPSTARDPTRRRLLQQAGGLAVAAPLATLLPTVHAQDLPALPALTTLLAGRTPRWERLRLEMPMFADNGQAVPIRLLLPGPFAPGPTLQSIHLFSERNPVADMAVFEFPLPPTKVEVDARVRLAGTQRVLAIALMSDGGVYAASADVEVTIAGCLDAS
ncbi:MAG TPA: thiosulfate oxidation carrier protein SoxY [Casimicrobiaceae bacterium]